jgi:hypothetical protein
MRSSAGQSAFINKQLSFLAPNTMFVNSGFHGFRGPPGREQYILHVFRFQPISHLLKRHLMIII